MRLLIRAIRYDARQAVKRGFADDTTKQILGRRLRKLARAEAEGLSHVTRRKLYSRRSSTAYWAV